MLVKNPNWSAATDPIRKQYPNEIDIAFNQNQDGIDNDLIAGNITGDIAGAGMAAASQAKVITDPSKKASVDDALSGTLAYVAISTAVKPFDNLDCRKAIEFGINKVAVQNSLGGPLRGQIASTVLPPNVVGYTKFNQYPTPNDAGDVTKAKAELTKCGKPNGFAINLAARGDRPNEVAAAVSIQASLKRIGVDVSIDKFPSGKYFSDYAGAPAFVHSHGLGMMMMAWGADWPTGYGFLDQMSVGDTIKASGNSNLSELNDPKVNSIVNTAIQNTDTGQRVTAWGSADKQIMADAAVVPLVVPAGRPLPPGVGHQRDRHAGLRHVRLPQHRHEVGTRSMRQVGGPSVGHSSSGSDSGPRRVHADDRSAHPAAARSSAQASHRSCPASPIAMTAAGPEVHGAGRGASLFRLIMVTRPLPIRDSET